MSYQAKKPRKKGLTVKVQRMWYVAIEDETGCEVEVDYCFGTREDALRDGQKLKEALLAVENAPKVNVPAMIFDGMNKIGVT